jgi:hypothetical protein
LFLSSKILGGNNLLDLNKGVARSLFSIDNKSIQIEEAHSIVSKNKELFLKHLGSFSTTMHDTKTLLNNETSNLDQSKNKANQDDMFGEDLVPESNVHNEFDLFDVDVPTPTQPVQNTNMGNDDDLFGLDIPISTPQVTTQVKTTQP